MDKAHSTAVLFERFGHVVWRRCRRLLGDDAAAEDATQEVFLKALVGYGKFRGQASPFCWLYRIATTYCLQQLRNQARREAKLALLAGEAVSEADPMESRILWRTILDTVDRQVQEIALLRHIESLTLEEIAARHGKAASNRLEEAAKKLPASLRPGGVNPLARLFGAFSDGVHDLPEEKALDQARDLLNTFIHLFENLREQIDRAEAYSNKIQSVGNPGTRADEP